MNFWGEGVTNGHRLNCLWTQLAGHYQSEQGVVLTEAESSWYSIEKHATNQSFSPKGFLWSGNCCKREEILISVWKMNGYGKWHSRVNLLVLYISVFWKMWIPFCFFNCSLEKCSNKSQAKNPCQENQDETQCSSKLPTMTCIKKNLFKNRQRKMGGNNTFCQASERVWGHFSLGERNLEMWARWLH